MAESKGKNMHYCWLLYFLYIGVHSSKATRRFLVYMSSPRQREQVAAAVEAGRQAYREAHGSYPPESEEI